MGSTDARAIANLTREQAEAALEQAKEQVAEAILYRDLLWQRISDLRCHNRSIKTNYRCQMDDGHEGQHQATESWDD